MRASDASQAASQHEMFAGLSREQIDELLAASDGVQTADATALLMEEGETDDALILLLSGEVEVLKDLTRGKAYSLGRIGSVAVLGELSLLLDAPRVASVRATGPVRYLKMHRPQFEALLASGRGAALALLRTMARTLAARLRESVEEMATLLDEKQRGSRPRIDLGTLRARYERPLTYTL
jgi:CRP-like cAMP-binding protein